MTRRLAFTLLPAIVIIVGGVFGTAARVCAQAATLAPGTRLTVFVDCDECFQDYLQTEVSFVDFVRDPTEADVQVLVTSAETGSGGREYALTFLGRGPFQGADTTLQTVTTSSDPDEVVRRQIATTLRVGLLGYASRNGVAPDLDVSVRLGPTDRPATPIADPWDHWVFSLRGSLELEGEQSNRQRRIGAEVSADRITPDWKITLGLELDNEHEEFDLDGDEPVKVTSRERSLDALVVKALGEHWSAGGIGSLESSTFDNTKSAIELGPAIEFNVFPYSMYTRRQVRALYSVSVRRSRYYETTLFGRIAETRPRQKMSLTYEQREPWGSLDATTEWSQYLQDLDKTRLELEGELFVRVARGLSIGAEINASRIHDQLALPARGATPEEILLQLRQLRSGYEYDVSLELTYTFGSIFSSLVNPRFGQ